jgi:hypothetical protein
MDVTLKLAKLELKTEKIILSLGETGWFDSLFRPAYCEVVYDFKKLMILIGRVLIDMFCLKMPNETDVDDISMVGNYCGYDFPLFRNMVNSFGISVRSVLNDIANSDISDELKRQYIIVLNRIINALTHTVANLN